MIARVFILLPFDLFISESDELPTLEESVSGYRIRFYPPQHVVERPDPLATAMAPADALATIGPARFSDSVLVNGKKTARANVLVMDFFNPEFNRDIGPDVPDIRDPDPTLIFAIANSLLARIRVHARIPNIKPLESSYVPFQVRYLTDDGEDLPKEEGKFRGINKGTMVIGCPVITPVAMSLVANTAHDAEPYVWGNSGFVVESGQLRRRA